METKNKKTSHIYSGCVKLLILKETISSQFIKVVTG